MCVCAFKYLCISDIKDIISTSAKDYLLNLEFGNGRSFECLVHIIWLDDDSIHRFGMVDTGKRWSSFRPIFQMEQPFR